MLQLLRAGTVRLAVTLVAFSIRRPRALVAAVLALTVALGVYTSRTLGIDTSTSGMLDPGLPFQQLDRELTAAFPALQELIVVVVEAPGEARAHAVADDIAERLAARSETLRQVYRPGGGPFFARNGLLYLDEAELWDLNDRLAEAESFLGTMANDPSLRGLFTLLERALGEQLSPANQETLGSVLAQVSGAVEAHVAGRPASVSWLDAWEGEPEPGAGPARAFVLAQPVLERVSAGEALESVRAALAESGAVPAGVRARITGSVAMETEELENVAQDAERATALSFGLVLLMLLAAFRSLRTMAALLLTLAVGLVWTGAFAAVAFGALNLISVSFAVLFIGMGVDFGIQFTMRFREEWLAGGRGAREALVLAASGAGGALGLAALIAASSFMAFAPTDYRGLAELGVISAFSMGVALLASLTLLPALLLALGVDRFRPTVTTVALHGLGTVVTGWRRPLMAVALLTLAAGALFVPRATFDFNPLNLRDPTTESVATFKDLLRDPNASPYTIEILSAGAAEAEGLGAALEALPEVDKVVTLGSYVPADQEAKLLVVADMRTLMQSVLFEQAGKSAPSAADNRAALQSLRAALAAPADQSQGAAFQAERTRLAAALAGLGEPEEGQLARLQTELVGDFPQLLGRLRDLLAAGPVSLDSLPAQLRERYLAPDGRLRVEVFPSEDLGDNQALRRFVRAVQGVSPSASGSPVSLLEGGEVVIGACVEATVLALVATVVLTVVLLGNLAAALLALVPVILAMCATVTSSVLLDMPFNLANIIALPLLIGLANAYGIYFVMRTRTGGVSALCASTVPAAVLYSALTTLASFGTLSVARHPGMAYMGVLVALSLTYALVFTLLVLPAIMQSLETRGDQRTH